jgi:hypothetical protein
MHAQIEQAFFSSLLDAATKIHALNGGSHGISGVN